MKIEWLNDDMTKARLTKGWFRKRVATVERYNDSDRYWRFTGTGVEVDGDSYKPQYAWFWRESGTIGKLAKARRRAQDLAKERERSAAMAAQWSVPSKLPRATARVRVKETK